MSIETYAVLFGIILVLVDIFFASDLPTFIAILLFSFAFFRCLKFNPVINIILTIIFFFVILIVFITGWKKVKELIIDNWFAKDKYKAGVYGFAGKEGAVKEIDGEKYALIDGDLYPFYEEYGLSSGSSFTVREVRDGKIVISSGKE